MTPAAKELGPQASGRAARAKSAAAGRDRDGHNRFMSDDDRRGQGYAPSGFDYEDERRSWSGCGHGGWFGDPEGHATAPRKGWEKRERDHAPCKCDEDFRRGGHGGWFGDPEGHADAARRGWGHWR